MECSQCNSNEFIDNHHLDYDLDITIPLCRKCHMQWHKHNKPIGSRKEYVARKRREASERAKIKEENYKRKMEPYNLRRKIYCWYERLPSGRLIPNS